MKRLFSLKFKRDIGNIISILLMSGALYLLKIVYKLMVEEIEEYSLIYMMSQLFESTLHSKKIIILLFLIICCISAAICIRSNLTIIRAGIKGEKSAKKHIKSLQQIGYRVVPNVLVPKEKGGFRELDFIVVGPKGIFVIESKNMSGSISGNADNKLLSRNKSSRRNGSYTSDIENPIYQVKGQVYTIVTYLRKHKINHYVDYIVAFTNKNVSLNISNCEGKVLKLTDGEDIVNYINKIETNKTLTYSEVIKTHNTILKLKYNILGMLNPLFLIGCVKEELKKLNNIKVIFKKILDCILAPIKFLNDVINTSRVIIYYFGYIMIIFGICIPISLMFLSTTEAFDIISSIGNIHIYIDKITNNLMLLCFPIIYELVNACILLIIAKIIVWALIYIINIPYKILKL